MNENSSADTGEGSPASIPKEPLNEEGEIPRRQSVKLSRLLYICFLAVLNAVLVSFIAKIMLILINFVTNISFYGTYSTGDTSPVGNHLGLWVILVPVIGGIIVGIMARFGSSAIRGHGIPETMEQVLVNKSRVSPMFALLKPISAAVSIGTGGPFGAEGPIIAAGGAFGSLIGQLLSITGYERKILLTSGATAGMSAIFGCPVAAVMLAIELLLFEFSPRSLIPVALACITGATGHILFFGLKPMFAMPFIQSPTAFELVIYVLIGALVGILSVYATKILYAIEDAFEKLPIHWMWWPAIGGLAVGIIGYFAPATMGVGYNNIRGILNGNFTINTLLVLCFLKFASWSISLGSGTSGSTLAPLFTIGGALGSLIAIGVNYVFPSLDLNISIAALLGMAAMLSGATRAFLTSVVFALETTGEPLMLLPLLGGSAAAYFASFVMMKSTIMTEKIARHGVSTPESYLPDILNTYKVGQVLKEEVNVLHMNNTIGDARKFMTEHREKRAFTIFAIVEDTGSLYGIISKDEILNPVHNEEEELVQFAVRNPVTVNEDEPLKSAVDKMLSQNIETLPVMGKRTKNLLVGVLSYHDILEAYKLRDKEADEEERTISLRKKSIRIIIKGRRLLKK